MCVDVYVLYLDFKVLGMLWEFAVIDGRGMIAHVVCVLVLYMRNDVGKRDFLYDGSVCR